MRATPEGVGGGSGSRSGAFPMVAALVVADDRSMDETATQPTPTPPPPAAAPPPRRLVRRLDERLLGGVAGGVAEYLGVDVVLVRLGFVVTAFFGGLGVIAYGLGWIVLPVAPSSGVPPSRGDRRQLLGYGLVALGLLAIGGRLGWSFRGDGVFWPLVLVGLGAAVLWLRTRDSAVPSVPSPSPPSSPPPPPPPPGGGT